MSQIIKNLASGPVPPSVATSYVTQDGTAIPAANVLIVNGFDSIENNDNGIITKGGVAGTGTSNELDVIITNRIQVTATTSDGGGQTQNVTVLTPTNATAVEFSANFIGYDAINNEAVGGSQEGIARSFGGATNIVGTNDSLDEADVGLISTDWNIIASGANLQAHLVGVAGRTINWTILFTFTQTT
jgi:hypothetical protein